MSQKVHNTIFQGHLPRTLSGRGFWVGRGLGKRGNRGAGVK